nr:hypothetical protein [Tanacetum cinerariifolium]
HLPSCRRPPAGHLRPPPPPPLENFSGEPQKLPPGSIRSTTPLFTTLRPRLQKNHHSRHHHSLHLQPSTTTYNTTTAGTTTPNPSSSPRQPPAGTTTPKPSSPRQPPPPLKLPPQPPRQRTTTLQQPLGITIRVRLDLLLTARKHQRVCLGEQETPKGVFG